MVREWPIEERFELASQARRSSNSAPANLAERHSDRHVRNRIEGVNRARGESLETIHHLYIASLKGYVSAETYEQTRERYAECVRMLNGLERHMEQALPADQRKWGSGREGMRTACPQAPNREPENRKLKTEN